MSGVERGQFSERGGGGKSRDIVLSGKRGRQKTIEVRTMLKVKTKTILRQIKILRDTIQPGCEEIFFNEKRNITRKERNLENDWIGKVWN